MTSILAGYTASQGACRGGNNPASKAGKKFYNDRNCKDRCDNSGTCTGYVLPEWSGANWCETYTSLGATGDGNSRWKCNMKNGGKY